MTIDYLQYARSLTFEQWRQEWARAAIHRDLWQAVKEQGKSLMDREPMRSIAERLHLAPRGEAYMWSLDGVSVSDELCSFVVTFKYHVRSQWYDRYLDLFGIDLNDEPPQFNASGEPDYYFFKVKIVVHANDDGKVVSSEVLDICAFTKGESDLAS